MRTVFACGARAIGDAVVAATTTVEVGLSDGWVWLRIHNPGDAFGSVACWPANDPSAVLLGDALRTAAHPMLVVTQDDAELLERVSDDGTCYRCGRRTQRVRPHLNPTHTVLVLLCEQCEQREASDAGE